MKIHRQFPGVEYWYDRSTRCWFARRIDAEGNQIGDAIDAYSREAIVRLIRRDFTEDERDRKP